jgi:hypothetical protein
LILTSSLASVMRPVAYPTVTHSDGQHRQAAAEDWFLEFRNSRIAAPLKPRNSSNSEILGVLSVLTTSCGIHLLAGSHPVNGTEPKMPWAEHNHLFFQGCSRNSER